MTLLKRTPLHEFHRQQGSRFVDFGGWEMPVQYRSILEEHRAVRRGVGLFDVSHMGEVEVTGPEARAFLNFLVTNDVARLFPGRVLYSPMCYENGGVVDDLLVAQRGAEEYLVTVNASNIEKDVAWMLRHAAGFDCRVVDRSDAYALLALQGPKAAALLQPLCSAALAALAPYHAVDARVNETACYVSRTGYSGEDGFELYCSPQHAARLAETLLVAGAAHELALCGLGARDSLRLEAGFPLYGHELSETISPLQAGLGWTVKLNKGPEFLGRAALAEELARGSPRKMMFFRTGDRRIVRAETPVLDESGAVVGKVASGTLSPILNEAIGSALIESFALGRSLSVDLRGTRLALTPAKPPFVPRTK